MGSHTLTEPTGDLGKSDMMDIDPSDMLDSNEIVGLCLGAIFAIVFSVAAVLAIGLIYFCWLRPRNQRKTKERNAQARRAGNWTEAWGRRLVATAPRTPFSDLAEQLELLPPVRAVRAAPRSHPEAP